MYLSQAKGQTMKSGLKDLSYAQRKKAKRVLLLGMKNPPAATESLNLDDKNEQDLQRIQQANDLDFNMLMLAVDDPISFEAVSSACTDSLPNGDAVLAWKKLRNIYAKKSTTKKGKLKSNFFACKLKVATNDPYSWFTKMELIRAKLE